MQTEGKQVLSSTKRHLIVIAILLTSSLASQLSMQAMAQVEGFQPQTGLLETSQGLSPDQDSFLPPEVVPQAETPGGVGQMTMGATPGQLTEIDSPSSHMNMDPNSNTQSPKDMRKAVFDSLMGNKQLSNQMPQFDPTMGSSFNPQTPQAPLLFQQPGQYALGQPDWLSMGANNNSNQYGNSSQTQTLTGGSKVPIVRRDIRKSGFSNNLSGATGLGAGLLTGLVRRPNSLFGLGFTGLTMTGFGVRNGFRF